MKIIVTPESTQVVGSLRLSLAIEETDTMLVSRWVSGVIDWGDEAVDTVTKQAIDPLETRTPLATYTHGYAQPGAYLVTITAQNYRSPIVDTDVAYIFVTVRTTGPVKASPEKVIYGPILPKDTGAPNVDQWLFNQGHDIETTESAIKLALITRKGERLHEPNLGTSLHRLLFEPNDDIVNAMAREEIMAVIGNQVPTVAVELISIRRGQDRRLVDLEVRCVSRAKGQTFQANIQFER